MADLFATKLRQWLDLLDEDPLEAIEVCKKDFEFGTQSENERKYATIALMSEFLIELKKSESAVKQFAALPFWPKNGYRLNKESLHTYVARYMLGAKETRGALYQQALNWGKVVKHCAEREIDPEDIPEYLSREGIYKLVDRIDAGEVPPAAKASTTKPKTATHDVGDILHANTELPEVDEDGAEGILNDQENTHRETNDDRQTANEDENKQGRSQDKSNGSTKSRRRSINLDKEISFEAGIFIDRILGIEEGDVVQVTLERAASRKDWKRLRATKIEVIRKSHALH